MAEVRPFAGFRYDPKQVPLSRALCPPYDVIDESQARALRADPYNAVHLELPEGEGEARYRNAAEVWRRWREKSVLVRDSAPSFYVSEETFRLDGRVLKRRGFLAALAATPKASRAILPHERTLAKPKEDRLKLLEAVGANVSPIFGIFPDPTGAARRAIARVCSRPAQAEGETSAGVRYRLWTINEPALCRALERATAARRVLIADGHHRFEVGRTFFGLHPDRPGADSVLAFLCPEQDGGLVVLPTHRIVAAGSIDEARLSKTCRVIQVSSREDLLRRLARSSNPYAFGLWDGKGYRLAVPKSAAGCKSRLCVEWVGRRLLDAVAPDLIRYTPDADKAQALARENAGTAVFVKPFKVSDIRRAVEKVGLLPPKSTYFYPKIATGLAFKGLER